MLQMNTKIQKKYYLVPLFFLFITGFLIFLDFNNRDNFFNIQIDKIQLSGSAEQGLNKNGISNVKLLIPGLIMNLSKEPAVILHKEGNKTTTELISYAVSESGLTLTFTNSLLLKINTTPSGSILFDIEYSGADSDTLILPSKFMSDIHQVSYLPCYTYSVSGENYMFSTKNGSDYDKTAGSLIIPLEDKTSSIVIDEISDVDPLHFYFFGKSNPISKDIYESSVESFIGSAYEGWQKTRYNKNRGEWLLSDGKYGLDNNMLTSFIAESIKRERFAQVENIVDKISNKETMLNFLSAPYLGNIVNTNSSRIQMDDKLKKKISKALKTEDMSLFQEPDLLRELSWISSSALDKDFSRFINAIDLSKRFSPAVLTGMLELYNDSVQDEKEQYKNLMRLYSVIEEQIFPILTRINGGLFLSEGKDNLFNTLLSIRTGIALYKIGVLESNELFTSIGRSIVVSVLNLSDGKGLFPEFIDREGIPHGKTYFGADLLYSKLISNEYYPHVVNFQGTAGSDISVWTVANTVSLNSDNYTSKFEFTYPRVSVHHLVIKGVEPFKSLQMNGIKWNSDTRFQYYSSGWVYRKEEKTLYIKLTQNHIREKIVLFYNKNFPIKTKETLIEGN